MRTEDIVQVLLLGAVIVGPTRHLQAEGVAVERETFLGAAEAYAAKVGAPGGAIAVVDSGGHLLYFARRAGTFLGSPEIAIGKARTAVEFKKATRNFEEIIAKGRFAMTALPNFTPLTGGVPIVVDGQIVGAIGVSGAKTADQDEDLALAGAAAFSGAAN